MNLDGIVLFTKIVAWPVLVYSSFFVIINIGLYFYCNVKFPDRITSFNKSFYINLFLLFLSAIFIIGTWGM